MNHTLAVPVLTRAGGVAMLTVLLFGCSSPADDSNLGSAGSLAVAGEGTGGSAATAGSGSHSAGSSAGGSRSSGGAVSGGAPFGGASAGGVDTGGAPDAGTPSGGAGGTAMAGAATVGGAATTASLVPASGALLGQYYGDGSIAETTARLGRTLAIHLVYYAWEDDWATESKGDLDAGRIPLVNWEPDGIDFEDIVSGSLDSTIKARAAGAKKLAKPFFLDFAAEMNGDEAWSGNDAKLYVDAYKHIHDLFVAAGATNVVWAWCPNVTDTDGSNDTTLDYYPGDSYVDWTGVDGYNWGASDWQSFKNVFKDIYPLLATKKKPILIGEMSSSETGGDKAQWIAQMVPTLKTDYPLIKGVVWFDIDKERDWRINSSATTLSAFKTLASDPFFNP